MSDIFISYASQDRERILPIVQALEKSGWSVFWDRTIPPGKTWRQFIGSEIESARCIVVVWTADSISSRWVQEEAEIGSQKDILIPLSLEQIKPPFGFGTIQSANLTGWDGDTSSADFRQLLDSLSSMLGTTLPDQTGQEARLKVNLEARRKVEDEVAPARGQAAEEDQGRERLTESTAGGIPEQKRSRATEVPRRPRLRPWFLVATIVVIGLGVAWLLDRSGTGSTGEKEQELRVEEQRAAELRAGEEAVAQAREAQDRARREAEQRAQEEEAAQRAEQRNRDQLEAERRAREEEAAQQEEERNGVRLEAERRAKEQAARETEAEKREHRAAERRKAEISHLLYRGKQAEDQLRLTTPANDNAADYYREVLRLAPENSAAKEGLQGIVERYLGWTEQALAKRQWNKAESNLTKAATVDRDHPRIRQLTDELAAVKQRLSASDAERMNALRANGAAPRGWLGVIIQEVTRELADSFGMRHPTGALVAKVSPGSPAEAGGLQAGDIILRFDGKKVESVSMLPPLVAAAGIGHQAEVEFLRNGNKRTLRIRIEGRPEE